MEAKEVVTMIVEIIIGLSVLVGAIAFIIRWCNKVDRRLGNLENKIDDLPNKIKADILQYIIPSAIDRISSANNPLSEENIQLRNRLLRKLQDHTICREEALALKALLDIENEEAREKQKWDLLFAIGIAFAAIALILSIPDKK
jgi:hypothetical protein